MKRYIIISLSIVANLAFAQGQKHIGFLMDDFYSIRWVKDSTAFASKVRELGHKVSIRVCDSDTALQHQQVKELIQQGVDVLVITPEDCNSSRVLVETAHKSHIPVIAYDRLILNSNVDYFISYDPIRTGEIQAQFIIDSLNGKGNIMLVNGPTSDQNANVFRDAQLKVLKPYIDAGKIKIIYDKQISEWTLLEAMMQTNEFLSVHKDKIDGVIAANDELAEGVLEALSYTRPGTKIPITGLDANPLACKRISNGSQAMTIYKPAEDLAFKAAIMACDLANGRKPIITTFVHNGTFDVPFIKLDPILVTKKNIQKVIYKAHN
jgi:D-xylose transport system substrate-binding protein